MTRMKQLALGGLAALAITGVASSAFAIEPGTFNYLAGASNGIPGGASLPPGLYTGLTAAEGIYQGMTGNQGSSGAAAGASTAGTKLGSFIAAVPLVWSTGYNFLGASYSVLAIQPFVTAYAGTSANSAVMASFTGGGAALTAVQQMYLNTVWQPINLSWNLHNGWFVSAAFSFQGPDGTRFAGSANPDYWTFEPGLGISYLSGPWNLTANLAYSIYTASAGVNGGLGGATGGNGYTNGNLFSGDTHALYKIGKWQVGPVADFEVQTTADKVPAGGVNGTGATVVGANQSTLYLGGLVGYDFGPVDVQVWAIDPVVANNTAQGLTVFSRIGFKLWGPDAGKPLVAKN